MEFSNGNKRYILKHQSDKTLEELAKKFHCKWQDVYECYSEMVDNGEYLKYLKEKRETDKLKKEHKNFFEMWRNKNGQGIFKRKNEESNKEPKEDNDTDVVANDCNMRN